ncbi:MAG TPA: peptide-methionine (R)-S-oxide reductase MsrB [Allosphingosinicella sp.]|jgi:peptide-methionine (R)-S-oxide reductase|nr:peptide-methionine (R)-S-oxide reductase MsrB [Allosphingosinicella sp.]
MTDTLFNRRFFIGAAGTAAAASLLLVRTGAAAAGTSQFEVTHTPDQWRHMLGAQRYAILREAATETPGTSPLLKEHRKGIFACAGCGLPVFPSETKFDSGTGWPSFWRPLAHAIVTRSDRTLGFERTEVLCRRCGGHLGHVFDDGPQPTGLRYCMNGLALVFRPA